MVQKDEEFIVKNTIKDNTALYLEQVVNLKHARYTLGAAVSAISKM